MQREARASLRQVIIENPIINSLFEEPQRHFRFSYEGITNESELMDNLYLSMLITEELRLPEAVEHIIGASY